MAATTGAAAVLVVEDEGLVALLLEETLADLGFREIYVAPNLAAARALLVTNRISFAILDVNLGQELVFPLAAELHGTRIPFLFSTGGDPDAVPRELAAYPLITKPTDRRRLVHALALLGFAPDTQGGQEQRP